MENSLKMGEVPPVDGLVHVREVCTCIFLIL